MVKFVNPVCDTIQESEIIKLNYCNRAWDTHLFLEGNHLLDNSEKDIKTEEIKDKVCLEGVNSWLSKAGLTANSFGVALESYTSTRVTGASHAPVLSCPDILLEIPGSTFLPGKIGIQAASQTLMIHALSQKNDQ